jgi:hypothetical protein
MSRSTAAKPAVSLDHQNALVKSIRQLAHRHSPWQVFSDFLEMSAIAMSNAIDMAQAAAREARYMQIVKGYTSEEVDQLAKMFGMLIMALEGEPTDVLGRTYHDLELHNKWIGQFFTPMVVCQAMAKMNVGDGADLKAIIEERGFVRAAEPSCGSAAMMIALACALKDAGINYQRHLHVTATDVDLKCVHMAYLQLSLLHIPAVVIHGNSLSLEEWGHWYTPAHIMNGWSRKLRRHAELTKPKPAEIPAIEAPASEPLIEEPVHIPILPPAASGVQLSLF